MTGGWRQEEQLGNFGNTIVERMKRAPTKVGTVRGEEERASRNGRSRMKGIWHIVQQIT